ncbi:MAG: HAMP domain-containing histidine kinase [Blautia sp.]|nr:HAMP domain-containing histidine kinase [Blautia sp.]MCM1200309.1 HAMP domain-containing histidine kinase [Bacteroides fragilis]
MRKQFIKVTAAYLGLFGACLLAAVFFFGKKAGEAGAETGSRLVLLNEIEQLTADAGGSSPAAEEIRLLEEELRREAAGGQAAYGKRAGIFYACLTLFFISGGLLYLYFKILRPFYKLEAYAAEIAKGNFDIALDYERANFFGAFTWAFDHMRKEIITAKKNEAEAVRENKTIIAALSHDIKTPLASIRAYAEGLEANLAADYEQRERYLNVIMRKCDEVSRLVNDLVLHSLSELERLEIREQKVGMRGLLMRIMRDLEYPDMFLLEPVPDAVAAVDEKRLAQALLNLLENAKKYAKGSRVEVWAEQTEGRYEIHARDYGAGILPEDMPFVTRRFYRGKNVQEEPGSGLGLYIVSYVMERMKGGLILENHEDGLEAVLWLPVFQ